MIKDLFRGKCKETGEWQYGDKVTEINGSTIKTFIHNRISPIKFNGDSLTSGLVLYDVVPETVGQYTGLKDRHGKEGYRKDLWLFHGVVYTIELDEDDAMFYLKHPSIKATPDDQMAMRNLKYGEIIGNHFDNPDLLGEVRE